MKILLAAVLITISFIGQASADYIVTGPITGLDCFLMVCSTHQIDAVEGEDGQKYSPARRYAHVSDYTKFRNSYRCRIDTKANFGLLGRAFNAIAAPTFYTRQSDGSFKEVDVESISFECVKE